jgi:hypothetical protein
MARNALIQVRRDTAANWTSTNPTLASGEMGFETDTGKLKIGTGSTAWTSLLYATDASEITGTVINGTTTTGASGVGYMGLPQNATTTGSYTIVAADAGKHIYSTATRTITIPSNASVAMPIGTTITFANATGATATIAITSDTLLLVSSGSTGSRTLAPFGMATAVKVTATTWMISGNGLT